jgi:alanyl-tRNA synthetase
MAELALEMNAQPGEVLDRVKTLKDERKRLENEVAQLRRRTGDGGGGAAAPEAREVNGVPSSRRTASGVTARTCRADRRAQGPDGLGRGAADRRYRRQGGGGGGRDGGSDRPVSAVDLVRAAVAELGGKGGGGRPDFAQGGGKDVANAPRAIAAAEAILKGA